MGEMFAKVVVRENQGETLKEMLAWINGQGSVVEVVAITQAWKEPYWYVTGWYRYK